MTKHPNEAEQQSSQTILAGRRFAELTEAEKAAYGRAREREGAKVAQAIVDNLNRNVFAEAQMEAVQRDAKGLKIAIDILSDLKKSGKYPKNRCD